MNHLSDRTFCIALAALLHDIGKPLQRANNNDKQKLCKDAIQMENLVKYDHSLWTVQFLFRNRETFEKLSSVRNYGFEKFQKLASKHHKPDSDANDELIIQKADCASAGTDRYNDKKEDKIQSGRNNYLKRPLDSIFSMINLKAEKNQETIKRYDLGELSGNNVMPVLSCELSSEKYLKFLEKFETDFKNIPVKNQEVFLDTLVSLVEKYFWCVPSSTIDKHADIPLCDHLITTSAIASAASVACEETGCSYKDVKFLYVTGDFSGIQRFIFSLTGESNRAVAKLLRGRSFMVNLYTILAARMITDSCKLPALNAITAAGGKFQVLVPDTPRCREALSKTKFKIEKWAFNKFYGELKILIDNGISLEWDDFKLERFQNVMKKAADSLNREKLRPFCSFLKDESAWIDNKRYSNFQINRICPVCGKEPGNSQNNETDECGNNCKTFIRIGTDLNKSGFVTVKGGDKTGIFNEYYIQIEEKPDYREYSFCYRINNYSGENVNEQGLWPVLHYACYVPDAERRENEKEDDDGKTREKRICKTFENIAKEGEGLGALAVLKADIDNMGWILNSGFRNENDKSLMSISRMVSFSRMVNWFFAGYMPWLINSESRYKNIYTLFAGGDDLCLIGRWDTMIDFTCKFHEEFKRYTGENLTLSASLELFKPGYPVSRAVDDAEEALKRSKNNGKNCITLLGYTLNWEEELESQLEFAENWKKFIDIKENKDKKNANKHSMLYRFLNYHKEWVLSKKKGDMLGSMKHRFRFIYDINRNLSPSNDHEKDWRIEEPFRNLLITKTPDMEEKPVFKYLPVGITIAAYSKRSKDINYKEDL